MIGPPSLTLETPASVILIEGSVMAAANKQNVVLVCFHSVNCFRCLCCTRFLRQILHRRDLWRSEENTRKFTEYSGLLWIHSNSKNHLVCLHHVLLLILLRITFLHTHTHTLLLLLSTRRPCVKSAQPGTGQARLRFMDTFARPRRHSLRAWQQNKHA